MTLKYILENVEKTKKDDGWLDFEIFSELGLEPDDLASIDGNENKSLKSYYFAPSFCTDSIVGAKAYFLDDELVCVSHQMARKSNERILGWASNELAEKTKLYLISLFRRQIVEKDIEILNLDEEFGDGYSVSFVGNLMNSEVIYNKNLCKVINRQDYKDGKINFYDLIIELDGSPVTVDIRDCLIPFKLKKDV